MNVFRRIHLIGLFAVLTVVGMLSLSDGAPRALAGTVRSGVVLADRIDPFGNVDLLAIAATTARSFAPTGADTIGHFAIWGAIGFLSTGLMASIRDRLSMLCGLFLLSAMFELGQQYLSWSRSASLSDLVANGAGLLVGYVAYSVAETFALPRLAHLAELRSRLGFTGRAGGGSLR